MDWTKRVLIGAVVCIVVMPGSPVAADAQPWRWYRSDSSARLQVSPPQTEVYVDGYLAGNVDDFDGLTQRLRLAPGEHVVEFYLDGHRTITEMIFFQPGEVYRLRHVMQPLASGEAAAPRPTPRATNVSGGPSPRRGGPPPPRGSAAVLAIRVQPRDAAVLIDGERWQGSVADGPLEIQVTPGPHRVEVQKDGYQSFSTTVEVRPGEQRSLNVSLTRSP
ncbi:MAG TPA: PEGA domain-containing protein [Vicinamibacterales bacterium]|nr:PEGA domain-containing protein [Vicinamibacterales bacterium]